MSYFIPRPRYAKHRDGPLAPTSWPVGAIIRARLSPLDLFGPADPATARCVIVQSASDVTVRWNANNGEYFIRSATFLTPLHVKTKVPSGVDVTIDGADLSATFDAASWEDVFAVLELIEYHFPAYLSLLAAVYVSIERVSGTIGNTEVTFELKELSMHSQITNEDRRVKHALQAMTLATPHSVRWARVLLAALYYQQALRLLSPIEVRIPSLNFAESVVNLTKALEILFSSNRDRMREGLRLIGLSDAQIEAQIIPLVLARNQLDGAHPVGNRIEARLISVLRDYVERAMLNVRTVLILATRSVQAGESSIPELDPADTIDRVALLTLMEEYLAQPPVTAD